MPANTPPADLITVFAILLGMATNPEVAQLLAPYSGIVLCSVAGAGLCLYERREEMRAASAMCYVLVRVLLAISLTVAMAEVLQYFFHKADPRLWLIPIAFLFGYIRDYQHLRELVRRSRSTIKNIGGRRDGNQ